MYVCICSEMEEEEALERARQATLQSDMVAQKEAEKSKSEREKERRKEQERRRRQAVSILGLIL